MKTEEICRWLLVIDQWSFKDQREHVIAQTPLSLPQWSKAFALRERHVE